MSENTEIKQAVKVSKTSINYAQKRGLKVVIDEKVKSILLWNLFERVSCNFELM